MFVSPLSGRQIQSELAGRMSRGTQIEVEGGGVEGLREKGGIVPEGAGRGLDRYGQGAR